MRTVVIDDLSSGADLVDNLQALGADFRLYKRQAPYTLTHPDTTQAPPLPEDLIELCHDYQPEVIVAGCEHAVNLADMAASHFTATYANDPGHSFARRDKHAMMRAMEGAGINHPQSTQARSMVEVERALESLSLPVVVKPSDSAGSDLCVICPTPLAVLHHARAILGSPNLLGHTNASVTLQEYIQGPQYYVNTVTYPDPHAAGGVRHVVTDVAHYLVEEIAGHPHITASIALPAEHPAVQPAIAYTRACLDALGVRFGASHTEIRDHHQRGMTLIEYNGRLQGPALPTSTLTAIAGHSQATIFAQLLHTGTLDQCSDYLPGHHLVGGYQLRALHDGVLRRTDLQALLSIPGVHHVAKPPTVGSTITTSNRVTTAALGKVFFQADTIEQAMITIGAIQRLEASGQLFHIEAA